MSTSLKQTICPGCRLKMPEGGPKYVGYFNTSSECWNIFSDVLGAEFSNAMIFSQVHQLTVDTYAVQHAGGDHPDKSIDIHLSGLYLAFEIGIPSMNIARYLQKIAGAVTRYPFFSPPKFTGPIDVFSVGMASSPTEHVDRVKKWSGMVWQSWSSHHSAIARFVDQYAGI